MSLLLLTETVIISIMAKVISKEDKNEKESMDYTGQPLYLHESWKERTGQ